MPTVAGRDGKATPQLTGAGRDGEVIAWLIVAGRDGEATAGGDGEVTVWPTETAMESVAVVWAGLTALVTRSAVGLAGWMVPAKTTALADNG